MIHTAFLEIEVGLTHDEANPKQILNIEEIEGILGKKDTASCIIMRSGTTYSSPEKIDDIRRRLRNLCHIV